MNYIEKGEDEREEMQAAPLRENFVIMPSSANTDLQIEVV